MAKPGRKRVSANARNSNGTNNTGEIVLSAIKKLMKNTGWTARTIVKFIKLEYSINDPNISRKVSRALKRGVRLGVLKMERGRYRLNEMSRLAHAVDAEELRERQQTRTRPRERPLRLRSRTPTSRTNATHNKHDRKRRH